MSKATKKTPAPDHEKKQPAPDHEKKQPSPKEKLKEARGELRELLAFIIDLQVPGHGEKQSEKVLNAIDNLIMVRAAGGGAPVEYPDIEELHQQVADHVLATLFHKEEFLALVNEAIRKAAIHLDDTLMAKIDAALDKATDPKKDAA